MNTQSEKVNERNYWLIAFLFMAVKLCLHFFTSTNYELHRDEMLYFNMSDHLDWGYASVPPLIGFMAFVTKTLFGYSVFGIRFFPALLGAACMYLMAKIIRKSGGGPLALVIALSAFLFSTGFLLIDSLFTPNVIEQFLWLLASYYLFRMTSENNPRHWIWIGLVLGLAFLNKYSVVYLIPGFGVALAFSQHRGLFNSRYFIYAVLIGFAIILPNIYWQYSHHWPVVFHMKELQNTQLVNRKTIDFFIDVFSLNLVSTLVWLIGLYAWVFMKQEQKNQYLGVGSLIVILLFLFSGGKGYYIMGLIPLLFAVGGFAMEKYLLGKLKVISYSVWIASVVFSFIALPFGLPVLSFNQLSTYTEKTKNLIIYPFYRWEDGKVHPISQVYSDMTGWHELTGYVAKAYYQLSVEEQKKCTIWAEHNYGYAGAVHFYGREMGLPEAVTFSDSYVIWAPESIPEGPIIYIYYDIGEMKNLYRSVSEIGHVNNPWFREKGLKVFLCTDAKTNVPELYAHLAREAKLIYCK